MPTELSAFTTLVPIHINNVGQSIGIYESRNGKSDYDDWRVDGIS